MTPPPDSSLPVPPVLPYHQRLPRLPQNAVRAVWFTAHISPATVLPYHTRCLPVLPRFAVSLPPPAVSTYYTVTTPQRAHGFHRSLPDTYLQTCLPVTFCGLSCLPHGSTPRLVRSLLLYRSSYRSAGYLFTFCFPVLYTTVYRLGSVLPGSPTLRFTAVLVSGLRTVLPPFCNRPGSVRLRFITRFASAFYRCLRLYDTGSRSSFCRRILVAIRFAVLRPAVTVLFATGLRGCTRLRHTVGFCWTLPRLRMPRTRPLLALPFYLVATSPAATFYHHLLPPYWFGSPPERGCVTLRLPYLTRLTFSLTVLRFISLPFLFGLRTPVLPPLNATVPFFTTTCSTCLVYHYLLHCPRGSFTTVCGDTFTVCLVLPAVFRLTFS